MSRILNVISQTGKVGQKVLSQLSEGGALYTTPKLRKSDASRNRSIILKSCDPRTVGQANFFVDRK